MEILNLFNKLFKEEFSECKQYYNVKNTHIWFFNDVKIILINDTDKGKAHIYFIDEVNEKGIELICKYKEVKA